MRSPADAPEMPETEAGQWVEGRNGEGGGVRGRGEARGARRYVGVGRVAIVQPRGRTARCRGVFSPSIAADLSLDPAPRNPPGLLHSNAPG